MDAVVQADGDCEVNMDGVAQEEEILPQNKAVWRLFDALYGTSKLKKVCEPVVSCEDVLHLQQHTVVEDENARDDYCVGEDTDVEGPRCLASGRRRVKMGWIYWRGCWPNGVLCIGAARCQSGTWMPPRRRMGTRT